MEKKLRLSKMGVFRFCILYLLLLGMWWFFRSYMLFLALILVPCLVILSGVYLWKIRKKIGARVVLPVNRVGKNTDFSFNVQIYNESKIVGFTADVTYRFGNLFTNYFEEKSQHLWVAPEAGAEIKQVLRSRHAGRIEAAIVNLTVYDLFHIVGIADSADYSTGVLVWPAFQEYDEEEVYGCVEGFPKENESKKRGAEYNPDYEMREYVPGDELKSIHWKLTAKQDKLMVRERMATGRDKINVLLPLSGDRTENDALIEALYGLCRLLLSKEYPIQLYWPGKGQVLQGHFVAEQGELENVISEILSGKGISEQNARELMEMERPGENYILVQTGAYKGAYIQ